MKVGYFKFSKDGGILEVGIKKDPYYEDRNILAREMVKIIEDGLSHYRRCWTKGTQFALARDILYFLEGKGILNYKKKASRSDERK